MLIVAATAILTLINPFINDMCKNQILSQSVIPNSNKKIVVFSRDCGATTSKSTQISILNLSSELKNGSGNIFIADSNHSQKELKVIINIVGSKKIKIIYSKNARVFKKEPKYQDIKIEYIKM